MIIKALYMEAILYLAGSACYFGPPHTPPSGLLTSSYLSRPWDDVLPSHTLPGVGATAGSTGTLCFQRWL